MIVTFKPKEKRRDKTDKVEIVKDALSANVEIFSASDFTAETGGIPTGLEPQEVGFDVNLYER